MFGLRQSASTNFFAMLSISSTGIVQSLDPRVLKEPWDLCITPDLPENLKEFVGGVG